MSLFSDFLNFLKFRKETEKLELEVKKLQQEITDRGSSIIKPTFDDIKKYASGLAEPSASSKSPPIRDQRELFFLVRPFRFYTLDFGIAIGIGAAIFMFFYIFITFVMNRFGAGTASLVFFEQIFPGFHLDFAASAGRMILGTLIGVVWSCVSGFVLGFLFGFIYNLRLRNYVLRRARQG